MPVTTSAASPSSPVGSGCVWISTTAAVAAAGVIFSYYYSSRSKARPNKIQHQPLLLGPFTVQDSLTHFTDLVVPQQCAKSGIIFGGELLSLMDLVGGTCAFRHCHGPVVTKSIDSVHIVNPAYAHDILISTAFITAAFGTSLEVQVSINVENARTGHVRSCCQGRLVFVHLQASAPASASSPQNAKNPNPLPAQGRVPKLLLSSPLEEQRAQAAAERRQQRAAESSSKRRDTASNRSHSAASDSESALSWYQQTWPAEAAHLAAIDPKVTPLVNVSETFVEVTKIVMPQHANPVGITFGGQIMAWMEQAAAIAAARLARKQAVLMVGLDRMSFDLPSFVGNALILRAHVTRVFGSSLEVKVEVCRFGADLHEASTVYCNAGYFTLVTIGFDDNNHVDDRHADDGNTKCADPHPRPVSVGKQVIPQTVEEQQEYSQALSRREVRLLDKKMTISTTTALTMTTTKTTTAADSS